MRTMVAGRSATAVQLGYGIKRSRASGSSGTEDLWIPTLACRAFQALREIARPWPRRILHLPGRQVRPGDEEAEAPHVGRGPIAEVGDELTRAGFPPAVGGDIERAGLDYQRQHNQGSRSSARALAAMARTCWDRTDAVCRKVFAKRDRDRGVARLSSTAGDEREKSRPRPRDRSIPWSGSRGLPSRPMAQAHVIAPSWHRQAVERGVENREAPGSPRGGSRCGGPQMA